MWLKFGNNNEIGFIAQSFPMIYKFFMRSSFSLRMDFLRNKHVFFANNFPKHGRVSYPKDRFALSMIDFSIPETTLFCEVQDDLEIGGTSKIKYNYNQNDSCQDVNGTIATQHIDKMTNDPYAAVGMIFFPTIKTVQFNAIKVTIKTDGNPIRFGLFKSVQGLIGGQVASAMVLDETKEWQTFEIPFRNMKIEDSSDKDFGLVDPDGLRIHGIKFSNRSQNEYDFKFQVKNIELLYDPYYNLPNFYEAQPRVPIMFYSPIEGGAKSVSVDNIVYGNKEARQRTDGGF